MFKKIVDKYFPSVLALVPALDQTFGKQIPGTTKKDILLNLIKSTAQIGEQFPEEHVEIISALVDIVASTLHHDAAQPAAQPAVSPAKAA